MSHLWNLKPIKTDGGNKEYEMSANDVGYVDVVTDYDWKAQIMEEKWLYYHTPYIELTEFKLKRGTGLQRFIYNMQAAGSSGESIVNSLGTKINTNNENIEKTKTFIQKTADKVVNNTYSLISNSPTLTNIVESTKTAYSNFKNNGGGFNYEKTVLEPYNKMYICKPTGWIFKFPYFANEPSKTVPNVFGDSSNTIFDNKLFKESADLINNLAMGGDATLQSFNSGIEGDMETIKSYNFPKQGANMVFSFPLLNTGSIESIQKNYQLVQLLKYQSRPFRLSQNLLTPVNIYSVCVPGDRFIPYAFINNIEIEMQGTRVIYRKQEDNPITILVDGEPQPVDAIIPEAYKITITMGCLVNDSRNSILYGMDVKKFDS